MSEKTPLRRRITPSVPFTLHVEDSDGSSFDQTFQLAFDLNAMAAFEEVTEINMLRNINKVLDSPSVSTLTALFWAALHVNHPEYAGHEGLSVVRSNITLGNAKAALKACVEAFLSQLPSEQVEKIRAAQKAGAVIDPLAQGPPATTTP